MLAADKRLLESRVVAGAVRIKQKEFDVMRGAELGGTRADNPRRAPAEETTRSPRCPTRHRRPRRRNACRGSQHTQVNNQNLSTVGTQAAVIAGFSVAGLIKFHTHSEVSRALQFFFYVLVMASLSANILCVANTTMLSVYGTSLATRGKDGSMVRAVDQIYKLRKNVFGLFVRGRRLGDINSTFRRGRRK